VVPPAGSGLRRRDAHPRRRVRCPLSARYRSPAARLASDLHAIVPARLAPSRARSVADSTLLLSVVAVAAESTRALEGVRASGAPLAALTGAPSWTSNTTARPTWSAPRRCRSPWRGHGSGAPTRGFAAPRTRRCPDRCTPHVHPGGCQAGTPRWAALVGTIALLMCTKSRSGAAGADERTERAAGRRL